MRQAGVPRSLHVPFYRRGGLAHLEGSVQPVGLEPLGLGGPRQLPMPFPNEETDTQRGRGATRLAPISGPQH